MRNPSSVFWCVCNESGRPLVFSIGWRRRDAIDRFRAEFPHEERDLWHSMRKEHGLTVRRVRVEVVPEGNQP